jgi:hypothetical protein
MSDAIQSAHRKVLRAMKHAQCADVLVTEYASKRPYELIPKPDGASYFRITEQPDIEFSVLAGEVLYQCRSALDHLFFDLVERHNAPLSRRQIHKCQFPLQTERPIECGPIGPSDLLPDGIILPSEAFAFVESLQPYNRWDDARRLLRVLAKLSNIDKHRHLTQVGVIARCHEIATTDGGLRSVVIGIELNDGAPVHPLWHPREVSQDDVQIERNIIVSVAFEEPELGFQKKVLLEQIMHHLPILTLNITGQFKQFLS